MRTRILEVLASLRRAGAERIAVSLACGLDPQRFETEVLSLYDAFPDGFEPVLKERGVPVIHLGKHRGMDLRMIPRLARAMREWRPSVIHSHSYVLRYVLPAAWSSGRPPLVHTVHNLALQEVDGLGRLIHRVAFRAGAVPVAVSAEVGHSFHEVYGADPAAVIPNGVDLDRFRDPAPGWRRANSFDDHDGLIVSVARLEPQKNPLRLIEAFARGLGGHHRWHLLMVGTGSLLDPSRQSAAALGVAGRVHFLGIRTDIPELLADCDLFALASDWEGSPVSVIEAMAAGLPVVATAVGGVPELVGHNGAGTLVPAGDTAALAQALADLALDPDRREQFSRRASDRASAFGVGAMVRAYEQLFERVAGASQ